MPERIEIAVGEQMSGWAACANCSSCLLFKSRSDDGSIRLYGTKNMTDQMKSCTAARGMQTLTDRFVGKVPVANISFGDRAAVKSVVEARLLFAVVDSSPDIHRPSLTVFELQALFQVMKTDGKLKSVVDGAT
jgi:hypothetical protein